MIDHPTLMSANYEKRKVFYQKALAPLGYTFVRELDGSYAAFVLDLDSQNIEATFRISEGNTDGSR